MNSKKIREIAVAWKEYKQPYVKRSTMAAYVLILENHIIPFFRGIVIRSMKRKCRLLYCKS